LLPPVGKVLELLDAVYWIIEVKNFIRMIKSRLMIWAGQAARVGELNE